MSRSLDEALDLYYRENYADVVHTGLAGRVQAGFHKAVERHHGKDCKYAKVLEVGATNGEHLEYVDHDFDEYTMLDLRDSPHARRVAAEAAAVRNRKVNFVVGDAVDLADVPDGSLDRLVSLCLLHHLDDPVRALGNWRRVLKPGGSLSVFVPCDPGAVWRLGRAATTFRAARARGFSSLEIRYMNACDHRNHCASLRWMIEGVFKDDDVQVRGWPFPRFAWNVNLHHTYTVIKN